MWTRIALHNIACLGPDVAPAEIDFSKRATAVIGISDTGKSFILELIDFMFGGETLRRVPPEGISYDTVLLALALSDGSVLTLRRAMAGGDADVLTGLVHLRTGGEVAEQLSFKPRKGHRTISEFFLHLCGMHGVVLRRNTKAETEKLTVRTLRNAHLVDIHSIVAERSPVLSGEYTDKTPEQRLFRYLITGVDDSALITIGKTRKSQEEQRRSKTKTLQFLKARLKALEDEGLDEAILRSQLAESFAQLEDAKVAAGGAEEEQITQYRKIRRLSDLTELAQRRLQEINGLVGRFSLLREHYVTDTRRLSALQEAAAAVDSLAPGDCPLCGAPEAAQHHDDACDADLPALATAAEAEVARIRLLITDLDETISRTEAEKADLNHRIAKASAELDEARESLPSIIDRTQTRRMSLVAITNLVVQGKNQLSVFDGLRDLRKSIDEMETPLTPLPTFGNDMPRSQTDELAKTITKILEDWRVPGMDRIFFDHEQLDIQINGKLRSAQGTGLRAVTHAAFAIGLMIFCLARDLPHPGFVVIDSPLNPYRGQDKPKGDDIQLAESGVHTQFYNWLANDLPFGQVIVLENIETTSSPSDGFKVHRFQSGTSPRRGFFPAPLPQS